jgi:hypothetical protein
MSATRAAAHPARAARSKTRASARRKKAPRFRPRAPEDFFSVEAWRLLTDELKTRAREWQVDGLPLLFSYGPDSEPEWDDFAYHRCSSVIYIASQATLRESMGIDLERVLRLLTLPWGPDGKTIGGRESGEWRAVLASTFWRIGQVYRELTRRKGAKALDVLREEIERLPAGRRAGWRTAAYATA